MANYSFPANGEATMQNPSIEFQETNAKDFNPPTISAVVRACLLYTSDAADDS